MIFALASVMTILSVPLLAHDCSPGIVYWNDAASYTRPPFEPGDDLSKLLVPVVTFGCVGVQEQAVIIIVNFSGGKPDQWIVVPAPWITRIVPLKEGVNNELEQQGKVGLRRDTILEVIPLRRTWATFGRPLRYSRLPPPRTRQPADTIRPRPRSPVVLHWFEPRYE